MTLRINNKLLVKIKPYSYYISLTKGRIFDIVNSLHLNQTCFENGAFNIII